MELWFAIFALLLISKYFTSMGSYAYLSKAWKNTITCEVAEQIDANNIAMQTFLGCTLVLSFAGLILGAISGNWAIITISLILAVTCSVCFAIGDYSEIKPLYCGQVTPGQVTDISLVSGGAGTEFTASLDRLANGGSGSGLLIRVKTIDDTTGSISTHEIVNGGAGYQVDDTVYIEPNNDGTAASFKIVATN